MQGFGPSLTGVPVGKCVVERASTRSATCFLGLAICFGWILFSGWMAKPLVARDEVVRPNVLFIAIDDLRPEMGAYGVDAAQTPQLDRLAAQSVMFSRHYVQVPTCGASRFAMLTGRSPWESDITRQNNAFFSPSSPISREATPGAQTMPELFRRHGYYTICIGKISHTPDGRVYAYNGEGDGHPELPHAWDELATPYGPWKRGWGAFFAYAGGAHREDGKGNAELFEFTADQDDDLPDGLMASAAISKLRELAKDEKPFFLGLGFFKPHLPFVATEADWQAFAESDIPFPDSPEKLDSRYWHGSGEFYRYRTSWPKTKPLTPAAQLTAKRAYLASVRYTDRQVGRVLRSLDELGLRENTIVVVWGDHGWHLGEHAIWGKHSPFEVALRSVLMIRAPQVSQQGAVCRALVETTDLFPTLVDLCDLHEHSAQHPLAGTSLRPLLEKPTESIRSTAISYWGKVVSIRTDQYRLIATRGENEDPRTWQGLELYDQSQSDSPCENLVETKPEVVEQILKSASERLNKDVESSLIHQ